MCVWGRRGSDAQSAADSAASQTVNTVQNGGYGEGQQQAAAQTGYLAYGQAIVVKEHDHGVKGVDQGGAGHHRHQKHPAYLAADRAEQIRSRRTQMAKVVIDLLVCDGNGQAAGEGDDNDRGKADDRDKDEQHQEYGRGLEKVRLIQYSEFGHPWIV